MKTLHIIVANKIATYSQRGGDIVCGNSDYQIEFTFDDEWAAYSQKTARFIWNGKSKDVVFAGTVCPVPIVANTDRLEVGVYAESLCTTTSAVIACRRSILCNSDVKSEGTVVVPEGTPTLIAKNITENGDYLATTDGADGFYKVSVKVAGGGEIPEGYIKPAGTKAISTNGTHDVKNYESVNVNVPTESGGTTEVIPEGYVKPSGTLTITENGIRTLRKDDGGYYDSVNVDVQGEEPVLKAQEITENGTYNANDYNADGFSSVTVNVESSGGSLEAPTISITNGILTITDTNESTKSFDIYVDGVFAVNIAKGEELDLLSVEMATGDHSITVKSLVQTSESNSDTYTASTNWEAELKGTWVMNDYVEIVNYGEISIKCYTPNGTSTSFDHFQALNFTETGVQYTTSSGGKNMLWQSSDNNGKVRYPQLATWEFRDDYAEYCPDGVMPQEDLEFLVLWLRANGVKDTTTDTQALNIITEGE